MRPKQISIGDLNLRVTIYNVSEGARNAIGNPIEVESAGVERWANVKAKPQSYVLEGGGVEYNDEFEITLRKPLALVAGDRIDFDGQQLRVVNVLSSDLVMMTVKAVGKE